MSLDVKESAFFYLIKHSRGSTTKKIGLNSKYDTTQRGLFFCSYHILSKRAFKHFVANIDYLFTQPSIFLRIDN